MVLGSGLQVQAKRYGGVSFVLSRCLPIGVPELGSPGGSDGRSIGSLGAGVPNVGKDSGDGFRASTKFKCSSNVGHLLPYLNTSTLKDEPAVTRVSEMQNLV